MSEIRLRNVCKQYEKGSFAVKNMNLDIRDKEFLVLVGPSGCGKSTALRMIAGLEDITDGELWIGDELCNYTEPGERGLSMVFQNYALYPNMTVYGNLAYALKIRKVSKQEIDEKVHRVARMLEIEHLLDRRPAALSGGQRQRVAIGSAIIRKPKAFLMDEPLSNLDARLRAQMRIEIAKLHKELGTTIIYVTHDQTEAMTLGTKIVVMKEGVVQQANTPAEVYENPANKFVAGFVGSPAMNFFDAYVKEENGKTVVCLGKDGSGPATRLSGYHEEIAKHKAMNKHVLLGVRPENIHLKQDLHKNGIGDGSDPLNVTLIAREMTGAEVFLYFELQGRTHTVRAGADNTDHSGDEVELYFDAEKIHLFDPHTEENLFYRSPENA